MISYSEITEDLAKNFGTEIQQVSEQYGLLHIQTTPKKVFEIIKYLYEHNSFRFQFLTDLAGIHFPKAKGQELGVIYHLHSLEKNIRLIIKIFVPIEEPLVPTLTPLFAAANWMEREAYDFYGILFVGHPNLKRILNTEDMDYFPMRKEFPLEDATREDKIDALFGR